MPYPPIPSSRDRCGFTLIEIIVILIIIALMLVILIPHLHSELSVRKAMRVKADLVTLNSAIEHYALDNGKASGARPGYADLRRYLDPDTDVYQQDDRDAFGDTYGPFEVGARPAVPPKTAEKLSNLVGPEFWSPFQ